MKRLFLILVALTTLTACLPAQPTAVVETTQISLPMGYIPNIQFAPFYVALDKGYFSENGIELSFDYAFETDGIALVGAGKTPFSLASGEQVFLAREQKLPIKYVFTWYKDYPISLITTDPEIKSLKDLEGKRIGLPGLYGATYIGARALIFSAGMQPEDVSLNSIGYTQIESILSGAENTVMVYSNNEPILLASQGVDFRSFEVAGFYNLASNGIVTNEETIQSNPALVRAFTDAFTKGLADTVNDPDSAYEISKKYIENLDQADEDVQKEILNASIRMWQLDPAGFSNQANWSNMLVLLKDMGLVTSLTNSVDGYTNEFVQ